MGLSSKEVAAEVGEPLGWPQIGNAWLDIPSPDGQARSQQQQRQPPPQLKCPRCDSYNTKFCYYNNYSRLQPRHFCKACRRYWTEGGTLRNVPVGGGRKNKRQKKTSRADSADSDPYGAYESSMNNAQFVNGDLESTVLPDVFQQIMLYPPSMLSNQGGSSSGGSSGMSLLSPPAPPLLLHELTETYSGNVVFNPPPISASASSSHHSTQIRQEVTADDLLLTLMPGSTAGAWLQDPPPLLSNYYSTWWDDTADFAALGQPATTNDRQES